MNSIEFTSVGIHSKPTWEIFSPPSSSTTNNKEYGGSSSNYTDSSLFSDANSNTPIHQSSQNPIFFSSPNSFTSKPLSPQKGGDDKDKSKHGDFRSAIDRWLSQNTSMQSEEDQYDYWSDTAKDTPDPVDQRPDLHTDLKVGDWVFVYGRVRAKSSKLKITRLGPFEITTNNGDGTFEAATHDCHFPQSLTIVGNSVDTRRCEDEYPSDIAGISLSIMDSAIVPSPQGNIKIFLIRLYGKIEEFDWWLEELLKQVDPFILQRYHSLSALEDRQIDPDTVATRLLNEQVQDIHSSTDQVFAKPDCAYDVVEENNRGSEVGIKNIDSESTTTVAVCI